MVRVDAMNASEWRWHAWMRQLFLGGRCVLSPAEGLISRYLILLHLLMKRPCLQICVTSPLCAVGFGFSSMLATKRRRWPQQSSCHPDENWLKLMLNITTAAKSAVNPLETPKY